jgi:hypothetical protein
MARSSAKTRVLSDPEEIRQWAEERGAKPTCVRRTGGGDDVGIIRLDFPGYSGEGSLQEIEWNDWFRKFEESNLALLVQDTTAGGQKSNFNKLVNRDTLNQREEGRSRSQGRARASSRRSQRGRSRTSRSSEGRGRKRTASAREGSGRRRMSRGRASSGSKRAKRGASTRSVSGRGQRKRTADVRSGNRRQTRVISRAATGRKSSARSSSRTGSQRRAA